ncbi:hypothetical protein CXG81DRAFT_21399 [Caulochytrium protostelioides]|uniref:Uncharacterized protein n=1 Tax=Caulochytrium protostelioides TaxID=1555241 RepID=A0A4V1ITV3_9FUNG|nr:hypothetical protein CXG81DRAFT_21399 [Caulochytrium protostelioides]|eukprot:RKO98357.1 hypothetical protein CXG81DRAFT_21399 [Caulochytrium protostelioides]
MLAALRAALAVGVEVIPGLTHDLVAEKYALCSSETKILQGNGRRTQRERQGWVSEAELLVASETLLSCVPAEGDANVSGFPARQHDPFLRGCYGTCDAKSAATRPTAERLAKRCASPPQAIAACRSAGPRQADAVLPVETRRSCSKALSIEPLPHQLAAPDTRSLPRFVVIAKRICMFAIVNIPFG